MTYSLNLPCPTCALDMRLAVNRDGWACGWCGHFVSGMVVLNAFGRLGKTQVSRFQAWWWFVLPFLELVAWALKAVKGTP